MSDLLSDGLGNLYFVHRAFDVLRQGIWTHCVPTPLRLYWYSVCRDTVLIVILYPVFIQMVQVSLFLPIHCL
jgi:hypothetical protein